MPTETKVKCANPFCDAPNETECAGGELCAFCEAEERTIIHNYKDESGPDEPVTGNPMHVNPIYEMSDEEWEQEQRDREEASRAYDHEARGISDEVEIPA